MNKEKKSRLCRVLKIDRTPAQNTQSKEFTKAVRNGPTLFSNIKNNFDLVKTKCFILLKVILPGLLWLSPVWGFCGHDNEETLSWLIQRAPHVTVVYFTQQMRQSKLRFQSCLSLTIGSRRAMRTSVRHTLDRYFPSGARIWRCTKMYLIAQKMNTTNVNQNSLVSWGFFRTIKNLVLFLHSYGCRKLDSNLQWPDHVTSQQDHKVIIDFCEKVCD